MPGAGVVPGSVTGALQHLHRERGALARVAVRDDLGAFGEREPRPHLARRPTLEQPVERQVPSARDVTLARIAVSAGRSAELLRCPHVQDDEVRFSEPPAELVESYVFHCSRNSSSTVLNRSGCSRVSR